MPTRFLVVTKHTSLSDDTYSNAPPSGYSNERTGRISGYASSVGTFTMWVSGDHASCKRWASRNDGISVEKHMLYARMILGYSEAKSSVTTGV